ncbi:MAG TPA: rod shape-determining protein MreD [Firmicutes bacterium]|uniref:Rod shape-determining protein MreD n=1 Tax=Capillibacterium thermochitinicola TaxID=2699427 RepID=A0A8J6I0I5_9FIRM|nr:rod shape-determining protein MreD [Capillibacterium thermochitinicola]HHW11392.1 rod shape-determining protein MreD [Bacillota bacterium]
MTVGKYVLFIFIPLVLQTSLFPHLSLFGVIPNLVLITTVCYGLLQGIRPGLYFGLLSGLCLDLAGSGILGINITILGLLGFGAGYLERLIFKGYLVIPLCMVLAGTIVAELFSLSILLAFGWRIAFLSFLGATLLPLCLYNMVLTAPVYYGLKKGLDLIRERRLKVGA